MGGYALYVWGSFGCAALVVAWNALTPRWRRASLLKALVEQDADEAAGEQE